jgi:hypothetical protein
LHVGEEPHNRKLVRDGTGKEMHRSGGSKARPTGDSQLADGKWHRARVEDERDERGIGGR